MTKRQFDVGVERLLKQATGKTRKQWEKTLTSKQWVQLAELLGTALNEVSMEDEVHEHLRFSQSFARTMMRKK